MAGVPCAVDSCSVTSTVDSNGRLVTNVRLNPTGGIECATDNSGLQIKIAGDPAASIAEACQNLGITSGGDLFAARPKYEFTLLSGTTVDFPASGAVTANSINKTITNLADCSRLVIATTQWQFTYTVDGSVDSGEYESDGTFFSDFGGSIVTEDFDIAGTQNGAGTQIKHHVQSHTSIQTIGAGASMNVKAYGTRQTTDHNTDGSGGSNGLLVAIKFLMLDLATGNLFSVV